jgi:hypothetical protein
LIAYFVAAGSLQADTDKETKTIEGSKNRVEPFSSGTHPNKDYAPEVQKRTDVLKKDINVAWRKLYDRQAPLLTWPSEVSERFNTWGRKWPTGVDDALIADTINSYVLTYEPYVDTVYKSFRPFDYDSGEGVVSAPSRDALLRPAFFSADAPPTLGKVWESQERLWVQRTVLDVIDKVNADAKDWDSAIIKQVVALDVASSAAQDQRSFIKGDTLELSTPIANPNAPADTAAAPVVDSASEKGLGGRKGDEGGGRSAAMGYGGMGGGGKSSAPEEFMIIKPKTPTQQYQVVPVYLSVYIDQNRIPDLIVGFQNSPMTIQVLDFEMQRPGSRVRKPAVGDERPMNMMGMGGGYGSGYGDAMMSGMGGMGAMRGMSRMGSGMMQGYGQGNEGYENSMGSGGTSAMMGGRGMGGTSSLPAREIRKGVSNREEILKRENEKKAAKKKSSNDSEDETDDKDAEKEKAKEAEKKKDSNESKINDPYFNVIEVRIYGQARFYNTPPAEQTPESQADASGTAPAATDATGSAAAPAAGASTDAAKKDEAPKADASAPGAEPAKDEAAKADGETPKAEDAKADGDMPAEKKEAAPKADDKKPESDKPDEAKKEPAAANPPGGQPSAPAAPKGDAGTPAPKR